MTFTPDMTRVKCKGGGGVHGGLRGEKKECSVLSFPKRVGSKRIANALIMAHNRQEEERRATADKGKGERLGLFETGCTGRLTRSIWEGKWCKNKKLLGETFFVRA